MMPSNPKKRQRVAHHHRHPSSTTATLSNSRISSTAALIDSFPDKTLSETSQKLRRTTSHPLLSSSCSSPTPSTSTTTTTTIAFNDPTTADVILRLFIDPTVPSPSPSPTTDSLTSIDDQSDVQIYLHSHIIRRAKYFSALLSDRWQNSSSNPNTTTTNNNNKNILISLKLGVPPTDSVIDIYVTVLELLYTNDFNSVRITPSTALDILPVALALLFEDCVKNCVRFLEAVPWTEEEELRVLNLIPFLREEESKELLARVSPARDDSCEEMLHGLIDAAIHNHPNMAFVKAFVAKLLREFSSRDSAGRVLERAFEMSLKIVKESMEEYSSPDFRGDHNETEAIQRLNLHTALTTGKHLLWLVERMIELRVADRAVKEWSEQAAFTADLQRAFRDDALRNIVPGLPVIVLRCTCKLANAVAAGVILASRQV